MARPEGAKRLIGYSDLPVGAGPSKVAPGTVVADVAALDVRVTDLEGQIDDVARVDLAVGVQVGSVRPVNIQMKDLIGASLARVQRCRVNVYTSNMLQALVGAITVAETGAGTEVSNTAQPSLLIETDATGAAQVSITDVGGAGFNGFLEVTPEAGTTNFLGFPRIIALAL